MTHDRSDDQARNRTRWDDHAADYQSQYGDTLARHGGAGWGIWRLPEDELRILGEVAGRDVLELGCGGGQWSVALARRGARPVGLDIAERQLDHARANVAAAGVNLPLVAGDAEALPFGDASFDVVMSDHGALSFADPSRALPEVARVLRPGGLLAFSSMTPLGEICWSEADGAPRDRLLRDYYDLGRIDEGENVAWLPTYGDTVRLLGGQGLVLEDLVELRPPADATSEFGDDRMRDWARRWPLEQIWVARRR
jgi:SAM-dependent methyltransferase